MAGFQKKERAVRGGGPPAGLCLQSRPLTEGLPSRRYQVVIVEAVGGRCAYFLVPTELLWHHGKGGLKSSFSILSVPAVKG